jgi:Fur family zinc uptake transcriptional regulator
MTGQCSHRGETSCALPSSQQVADFLHQAEQLCAQRKLRFTELRRTVLELVCQYEQPVGAYVLLDDLRQSGRSAAPPTVYRALSFLQQQGLVHRLANSNTYLACAHPQQQHAGLFLLCRECGFTREVHTRNVSQVIKRQAQHFDFDVEKAAVEVIGLCGKCSTHG